MQGLSKHTGGIQTYGDIQTYREPSNIWRCPNIWGDQTYRWASNMGVSKTYSRHPNI